MKYLSRLGTALALVLALAVSGCVQPPRRPGGEEDGDGGSTGSTGGSGGVQGTGGAPAGKGGSGGNTGGGGGGGSGGTGGTTAMDAAAHDLASSPDTSGGADRAAAGPDASSDKKDSGPPDAAATATFAAVYAVLVTNGCLGCHSWAVSENSAFSKLGESYKCKDNSQKKLVVAGNPTGSLLVALLTADQTKCDPQLTKMPKGGDALTAEDLATVKAWIQAGAKR